MKAVTEFRNPVTQKRQAIKTGEKKMLLLGFDEEGKNVYQEYLEKEVVHMCGFLPDAKTFINFK